MPSSQYDALGSSQHNSPPLGPSIDRLTSTHSPPHASLAAPFTDPSRLDPLVLVATSFIDPPPPPPPPHVSLDAPSIDPLPHMSLVESSTDPLPLPDMGIDRPSISSSRGIDASSSRGEPR